VEFVIEADFLTADECRALIEMIEARRCPSQTTTGEPGFRTSETCYFAAEPIVSAIDARIAQRLGLSGGEPIQGQRYAEGEEFKAHRDTFGPDCYDQHCSVLGQRTWTAMVYLNEPEEGGATGFDLAGLEIMPREGMLLAWNNLLPDGSVDALTLHRGMPVIRGTKYVLTKWFRGRV
jgi:prolyl 4-hydroxylase